MKKFAILSLILAGSISAFAQENRVETTTKTETVDVEYHKEYNSKLSTNWYIQAALGGSVFFGEDDSEMSFGDRIKPGFSLAVGRQFNPLLGGRLSFEGNRLVGWNDNKGGRYPNHLTDPRKEYLDKKGVYTDNGYDQDIRYYALAADFMLNLTNLLSEDKNSFKRWDLEAYLGVAALSTMERKGVDNVIALGGRFGISTTYNINQRFGINLDINSTITSSTIDGHTGESGDIDNICSARLGLKWRIGKQEYRATHAISNSSYDELNNYIVAVKTQRMEQGAPEEQIVVVPAEKDKIIIPYVVFEEGKETFNQELQMANIFNISELLKEKKDLQMDIVGNTRSTNAEIALKRANIVKDILVSRYSIDANRLTVKVQEMDDDSQTVHFVNK
ncbi:MAG: hypothetical protein IJ436_00695 [Bacteroidaceae bacterium]|nr:hypothetical protein [Bacteroidaceae bacterium]